MKKTFGYMIPVLVCLVLSSCKKSYLETAPSNAEDVGKVFSTTAGGFVALDGIFRITYSSLTDHGNFGQKSYDLVADLMGTDMTVHTAGYGWFNTDYRYTAQLSAANNGRSERMWYYYYRIINNANQILDNIDKAVGSQSEKDILKGQALALRAHSYYYLINFFQQTYKGNENKPGVPIYKTSTAIGVGRGTVQQVYDLIVADLTQAETLLTGKSRVNISHINVNVVQGIRARVALTMEDYPTAATYANKARTGYNLMSTAQYQGNGFSSPNTEWMWGMQIITDQATIYASLYSHVDISTGGYAALGTQKKIIKSLYDQINIDDVRKKGFTAPGSGTSANPEYNQVKLKVPSPGSWAADYLFMRAGEMYLIEAEALARQGAAQEAAARTVLETLVKARWSAYTAAAFTGTALLNEILLQRRIELWGEGFSLFDVKRLKAGLTRVTGAGNHGASYDPITYTLPDGDPKFLMRIPQREIDANEKIEPGDQNPQ